MEVKVVMDRQDKIVSALYQTRAAPDDERLRPLMGPLLEDGQTLVELGVPDEYATYPVVEFVERITTDARAKVAKGGPKQK